MKVSKKYILELSEQEFEVLKDALFEITDVYADDLKKSLNDEPELLAEQKEHVDILKELCSGFLIKKEN